MQVKTVRTLWPLVNIHWRIILLIIILGTISSAAEGVGISFLIPLLQGFESVQTNDNHSTGWLSKLDSGVLRSSGPGTRFWVICSVIAAALLLKAALSYITAVLAARSNVGIGHDLRSRTFQRLLSVSQDFLDNNEWGKLLDVLSSQTWRTADAIALVISAITNCCTIAVFAILLLFLSWRLTLAVMAGMIFLAVSLRAITMVLTRLGTDAVRANENLGKRMIDGILGLRSIRAYGLETFMQDRFNRTSDEVRGHFFRLECWSGLVTQISEMSSGAVLLAVVFVVRGNSAGLPMAFVTIMILYRLQSSFRQLEAARVKLAGLTGAAESVASLLDTSDQTGTVQGQTHVCGPEHAIVFKNVTFSYPTANRPAIRDLNLSIPRGKVTALAGSSGAGKTTIINLLCRFYDPSEGEIEVDGRRLRDLDVNTWRKHIALAGQDVHLFNTTLHENIGYGRLGATKREIIEAARRAGAHDFISDLPDGYETLAGNEGLRLSGGQRQRIALARAFLRKPEILILDEATNALDSLSERWIQAALDELGGRCTVIISAHRLSTIQSADQIIVLDRGQLLEQGHPATLLNSSGFFHRLYAQDISVSARFG